MHSFIVKRQPPTFNSWKKASVGKRQGYKTDLEVSFRKNYGDHIILNEELYGIVYYFFNKNEKIDSDNLSKPLWDCLTGFLFNDDSQVKLRIAGTFDLTKNDFNILDFSGLKGELIDELLEAFDTEDHVIFIECGRLNYSMLKFNLE